MNEVLFATSTVLIMLVMLACYKLGRVYLMCMVAVCLLLSNVIGPKVVTVFGFAVTAGTPIFAAIPLGTDLLAERYGTKTARMSVYAAFAAMFLLIIVSRPLAGLETAVFAIEAGNAVDAILTQSLRLLIASPVAYCTWQMVDIVIFDRLKRRTNERLVWLRNNASAVIAHTGSTFTFFFLAFSGTPAPWVELATVAVVFYYLIAVIDTLFMYLAQSITPLSD